MRTRAASVALVGCRYRRAGAWRQQRAEEIPIARILADARRGSLMEGSAGILAQLIAAVAGGPN